MLKHGILKKFPHKNGITITQFMTYYSLNGKAKHVNFETAVRKGLAEDKGLYFPEHISALPKSFYDTIENLSPTEIGYQVIKQFVGDEIPENDLKTIISETLDFKFPIVSVEENVGSLELYHGPTLAFKDVGARFMARCLGYFNTSQKNTEKVTVLVATSGDTGGAVANGFYNVEG
ncbi:MAG TPA: threonine synthase, partial [Flavobacteriaceae bacterium]|nr:threonine synthase [Flavobacteriaceae bacterium]